MGIDDVRGPSNVNSVRFVGEIWMISNTTEILEINQKLRGIEHGTPDFDEG